MADGSLEEAKYHLLLSYDLKYIDKIDYERLSILAEEVGRMLFGFQKMLAINQ
jgi:four helix bundle protein